MCRLLILSLLLSELIIPMPSRMIVRDGVPGRQPVVKAGAVNWWTDSAEPGEGDNVVLYGHSTDVFANLHEIQPGAVVTITWRGVDFGYVVRRVFVVDEDTTVDRQAKNGRWIDPVGHERLTMVTCAGKDRLIVIAYPKS